jgi:hypothetical protein
MPLLLQLKPCGYEITIIMLNNSLLATLPGLIDNSLPLRED